MSKHLLLLALFFSVAVACSATKWKVGASEIYTSPSMVASLVNHGDTVEINGGAYTGDVCTWTKNNLVLIGVNGRPHLKANGANAQGKGIWVTSGNNIRVENIEFSEAAVPDKNGAGIRAEGQGLYIINCYFHHNENGILTNASISKIVVENSEFSYNGINNQIEGGYTHNIYIGNIDTAIIRFNYFHHAYIGHELKSRARVNYLLYNRFSDEDGNASRNIDLPNGGLSYIIGNIIEQGLNSDNSNLVGYGLEGLSNAAPHAVYCINNTFVNNKGVGIFIAVHQSASLIKAYNNIFAGGGTIIQFTGAASLIDSSHNLIATNISSVGFVNAAGYDYHLNATSPAVNAGIAPGVGYNNFFLTPEYEYVHIAQEVSRPVSGDLDIGAYEVMQVLPLKIVAISATLKNENVSLEWHTQTESNISLFEIQKSVDGISFETIGFTNAANKEDSRYSHIDNNIKNSIQYYRLKIVEKDGSHYFSKTVLIKTEPSSNNIRVTVNGNAIHVANIPEQFINTNCSLQLYDFTGRRIFQQQVFLKENNIGITNNGLAKQMVVLVLQNESQRITYPFSL